MVAASVWSLLIPAMEMSDHLGQLAFLPAAAGFLVGIVFLLALDASFLIYIWAVKNLKVQKYH